MRTEGEEVIDNMIDSGLIYILDICYNVNRSLIKDLLLNAILLLYREVRSHLHLG